jgi:hypothetical protein
LLILLLIGYSQLFAHLYAGYHSQSQVNEKTLNHDKALGIKSPAFESNYILFEEEENEEDDKVFLKCQKENISVSLFYNHAAIYTPLARNYSSFFKHFSFSSLFRSQYLVLCVFRI